MSSKRTATSDLNHENWDRDEEPEEKGIFKTAPEDELKNRVIKKARRKLTGDSSETNASGSTKSVFGSFVGFGKSASTATTISAGSPFSFLSKSTTTTSSSSQSSQVTDQPDNAKSSANNNYGFDNSSDYYAKLKGLNQTVSNWIKTHVDQNSLCILTPIFQDYERYLKEIQDNHKKSTKNDSEKKSPAESDKKTSDAFSGFKFSSTSAVDVAKPAATSSFSFGSSSTEKKAEPEKAASSVSGASGTSFSFGAKSVDKPTAASSFSFGAKTDNKSGEKSTFSFGNKGDNNTPSTSGFSFGGTAKPFTFANVAPPPADTKTSAGADNDEDEEDQPPKVEFKQVVEEDSIFSKKCKVFVKQDGSFADRGVGTLYLKPVEDQNRTQLLVRADTNLGNILVNFILNETIPTRRMGKNNVMMVCFPTPDIKEPTQILIRVKTGEEADELLETLEKYKNSEE